MFAVSIYEIIAALAIIAGLALWLRALSIQNDAISDRNDELWDAVIYGSEVMAYLFDQKVKVPEIIEQRMIFVSKVAAGEGDLVIIES